MPDFGVTPEGFNRKRLDQLLQELNDRIKSIFGENFNVNPESPDGQVNGVLSESDANLWELAEECYNAFNPSAATNATLSDLVQLNGLTRLPATSSRALLTITGTVGVVIPAGSLVSTVDTGDVFATEIDVTIGSGGTVTVFASATITGPVTALASTITVIDTPVTGWATVTNLADAVLGTNEETDVDLRARRRQSVARDAQAILDAIFAAVAAVPGVTQTVVLENDTNSVDANGLPPHSFQVVVVGGSDEDIGNAIWLTKPTGITTFGTSSYEVLDSQGVPHVMNFSRPTTVDIYVDVTISAFPDFPANGAELIQQAIVDYANGILVEGRGFSLNEDVIYTRLYTPINSVPNHSITSLFIGLAPSPSGTVDIPIGPTEISNFLVGNITVTVT